MAFVTGFAGGPVSEIYSVIAVSLTSLLTSHFVSRNVSGRASVFLTDFLFCWAAVLATTTIYANRLGVLAVILGATAVLAYTSARSPPVKPRKEKPKKHSSATKQSVAEPPVAYRSYLTVYRASMLVLTVTAILAVDFSIFPRRFAKTETWGTSVMDLGVGSFVFSMGVVTARRAFKYPDIELWPELKESLIQTSKVLALGLIRLLTVKVLNYQEHVTEYGVHWNFFFTLGLLPFTFTVVNRLSFPGGSLGKGVALALGYELLLKNTGLQEWVLAAPRVSLVSQNKEGLLSFAGYLAIFIFGHNAGLKILSPRSDNVSAIKSLGKTALIAQIIYSILTIATQPSRRIANLPYIVWVVTFNSGLLAVLAALQQFTGMVPSPSYVAVNKHGEAIFILANIATGLVNLSIDTLSLGRAGSVTVLLAYQLVMMMIATYLSSRNKSK